MTDAVCACCDTVLKRGRSKHASQPAYQGRSRRHKHYRLCLKCLAVARNLCLTVAEDSRHAVLMASGLEYMRNVRTDNS